MRILQVHNRYLEPGGEDTIGDAEAELLSRAGHEVVRLQDTNPSRPGAALGALALAPYSPLQERRIGRVVASCAPDVAHVHNTWYRLTPSILHGLRAAGVPTVMTLQNFRLVCAEAKLFRDGQTCTRCVGDHPWHGVRHRCYRGSAVASLPAAATIALNRRLGTWARVDRLIAPSETVRDVFLQAGFAPQQLVVRPNFVEDPGTRTRPAAGARTVLYVGRLSPEKGLTVLLDAWRRSRAHALGLRLVIVGDGPQREELAALAPPDVELAGFVSPAELPARMLGARALVFPTQWNENFGRSIIEAMAAGLPVLASDIGTPAEVVGELGADWLVAPADRDAWAAALEGLADDDRVASAGDRARALFERRYSPERGLESLLAIYRGVMPAGSAGAGSGPAAGR